MLWVPSATLCCDQSGLGSCENSEKGTHRLVSGIRVRAALPEQSTGRQLAQDTCWPGPRAHSQAYTLLLKPY